MNRTKTILLAASALATLTIAGQANAQTAPAPAPGAAVVFLPGVSLDGAPPQCGTPGVNVPSTSAIGISADGSVVAGESTYSNCIVLWRNGVPELQPGFYPDPRFASSGNGFSRVTALSGNGRVVVGHGGESASQGSLLDYSVGAAQYWTAATDAQFIPVIERLTAAQFNASLASRLPGFVGTGFTAFGDVVRVPVGSAYVNNDGTYFAVNSAYSGDFRYPAAGAFSVQFDGRVLRWSPANGYQELPTFGDGLRMGATGIDGSGNRIVGQAYSLRLSPENEYLRRAFLWDSTTGLVRLPDLASSFANPSLVFESGATGISRDGTTVIGFSRAADGISHPVLWRGGAITDLGFVAGRTPTMGRRFDDNVHTPLAASAGGTVIVGRVGDDCCNGNTTTDRAWRWSAATGMQELQQIAINAGLNLNGYVLYEANGISDNGQFISGNAYNGTAVGARELGYVLQLAQVTHSRLIVTIRLPGVTQQSIVNQTFNTQVDALLNGTNVFTRTVTDPITGAGGVTALADARAALQVGSGLRRVVIGAPTLLSNVTTVLGTINNTVDVASGSSTSTATINTFGPATVITGDLGVCATGVVGSSAPTGCSLPGTPVTVDAGILNSNVYTQTNNSVIPTTTQTVNQLITAKWQIAATAGNQFGTVHALVGPAAFERGDRLVGQLLALGGGDGAASSGMARAAMPGGDESGLASGGGGGESGLTMFGGYFGGRTSIDADASIPVARVKGDSDGFVLGLQQALGYTAHVGIALDHGSSDYTVRDPLYPETLKLKHTQAALFAGYSDGGFSLSGAASYGFGTARTNMLTPTTPATGKRDINSWSLGAQAGYAVSLGKDASLTPHIGIRHTSAKLKGFIEVGGPTPLLGLSQTVDRTRLYAGLEAKAGFDLGGLTLTPRLYGRIARDSGDASGTADLVFASAPGGPAMQALGPGVGKTLAEYGASIDADVSETVSIWAGYDGSLREGSKANFAKAGLSIRW
jgi:probable HAF family extracellular repeat protein